MGGGGGGGFVLIGALEVMATTRSQTRILSSWTWCIASPTRGSGLPIVTTNWHPLDGPTHSNLIVREGQSVPILGVRLIVIFEKVCTHRVRKGTIALY